MGTQVHNNKRANITLDACWVQHECFTWVIHLIVTGLGRTASVIWYHTKVVSGEWAGVPLPILSLTYALYDPHTC